MAVDLFFVGSEVAGQRRTTEFVVKRRAAQRTFGHDIERGNNTVRLTKVFFPRLFKARNTQVGNGEAHQPGFRFCTTTGCTLVADFAAGAGSRARPRRDSRRVVVGFNLHQNVGWLLMEIVAAGFVVGKVAAHFRTFHDRGVVFIGRQHVVRRGFESVFNHLEQRLGLQFTVDNPVGVKNFVAAVLGVSLRKHVQFNVVRVASQFGKRILQIVDFVFRQRQTETLVSIDQRLASLTQQINTGDRRRLVMDKQFFGIVQRRENRFHHAVVQFVGNHLPLLSGQRRGFYIPGNATFQTANLLQAAVVGNISRFRRPRGDGARARRNQQQFAFRGMAVKSRTIFQQAYKLGVLILIQRCIQIGKMDVLGVNIVDLEVGSLKTCQQFVNTECRQCR